MIAPELAALQNRNVYQSMQIGMDIIYVTQNMLYTVSEALRPDLICLNSLFIGSKAKIFNILQYYMNLRG